MCSLKNASRDAAQNSRERTDAIRDTHHDHTRAELARVLEDRVDDRSTRYGGRDSSAKTRNLLGSGFEAKRDL